MIAGDDQASSSRKVIGIHKPDAPKQAANESHDGATKLQGPLRQHRRIGLHTVARGRFSDAGTRLAHKKAGVPGDWVQSRYPIASAYVKSQPVAADYNGHSLPTNSSCKRGILSLPVRRPRTTASIEVPYCWLLILTKRPGESSKVVKTAAPLVLIFSVTVLSRWDSSPYSSNTSIRTSTGITWRLSFRLSENETSEIPSAESSLTVQSPAAALSLAISYRRDGSSSKLRGGRLPTKATPISTNAPFSAFGSRIRTFRTIDQTR